MGSGSSKLKRQSSNPAPKQTKSSLANTRSISFPSYLSSLQKQNVESKSKQSLDESPSETTPLTTNPRRMVQRFSEPNMIKATPATTQHSNSGGSGSLSLQNGSLPYSEPVPMPSKVDLDGSVIDNQSSLTIYELYNILTAETWLRQPQLLENEYLLLLDCRSEEEYNARHIVTARHHACLHKEYGCLVDVPGQLESFHMIVMYGDQSGNVTSLLQARNVILYKLNLNFKAFIKTYPFLCTDKPLRSLGEKQQNLKTWPSEILAGKLYQGNATHALDENVVKALGITHIVNITLVHPNAFPQSVKYMRIQLADETGVDLQSWLSKTSTFIRDALKPKNNSIDDVDQQKNRVLIHCNSGRSRSSTVMLGYLMEVERWSLQDACELLKDCRPTVEPNIGFLNQLLNYEKKLFGKQLTDFHQIPF